MAKGTFLKYSDKKLSNESLKVIDAANAIITEYESRGYSLTLRQLYYQFVARGMIANSDKEYDRLGSIISNGRMIGLVSWTALEDRGRNLMGLGTFNSPQECMIAASKEYRIDMWANQHIRPEVWVEKQAMEGVISGVCNDLRVDFFATKGYNSQSEQWRAGMRFANYIRKGQRPVVIHLADHDPSGFDMTRDLEDRLEVFAGTRILVRRVALNADQVHRYSPPPNPAKVSDSRYEKYVREYGEYSWEMDALSPDTISAIIRTEILSMRDEELWAEREQMETDDKEIMKMAISEMPGGDEE